MEDGRPFCPKCRAPQVRVELAALTPDAIVSPVELEISPADLSPSLGSSTDPAFFRVALQAGLLGIMANLIPFGLGMVLTGILSALLYHRIAPGTLRAGKAARLGAVSGAISFVATALLIGLAIIMMNSQQKFHDFMMNAFEQSVARQSGPDVQSALQLIHTPQGFGIVLAFGMIGVLLLSIFFSAVGGVIGSALFRDRNRPPF